MFGFGEADENDFKAPRELPKLPATMHTMGGSTIYPPVTSAPLFVVRHKGTHVGIGTSYAEAHELARNYERERYREQA